MKNEYRTGLEASNEGKGLALTDELLAGVSSGGLHHHKRRGEPKPDWTEIDPDDGSSGITFTW